MSWRLSYWRSFPAIDPVLADPSETGNFEVQLSLPIPTEQNLGMVLEGDSSLAKEEDEHGQLKSLQWVAHIIRPGHVCTCCSGIATLKHSFRCNDALLGLTEPVLNRNSTKPQKSSSVHVRMLSCGAYSEATPMLETSTYITLTFIQAWTRTEEECWGRVECA